MVRKYKRLHPSVSPAARLVYCSFNVTTSCFAYCGTLIGLTIRLAGWLIFFCWIVPGRQDVLVARCCLPQGRLKLAVIGLPSPSGYSSCSDKFREPLLSTSMHPFIFYHHLLYLALKVGVFFRCMENNLNLILWMKFRFFCEYTKSVFTKCADFSHIHIRNHCWKIPHVLNYCACSRSGWICFGGVSSCWGHSKESVKIWICFQMELGEKNKAIV